MESEGSGPPTPRPTRIAIFMADLSGGGAERMMVHLANGLSAQGIRVDLLLAKAAGPYLESVSKEIDIREVSPTGGVSRALPYLAGYLRNERPDLLISTLHHASLVALAARRLSGRRIPVIIREANTPSKRIRSLARPKDLLSDELARLGYRFADGIVAVSQGVADDLARHFRLPREKLEVLHNPVVTEDILTLANRPADHPWLEPGQPPVILGMGRLHVQKDFATLIRAFARVRESREARLLILGEGEERERLERLAGSLGLAAEVELPGFVENPFAYLARADLFVLSSQWEGLPGALIQALACGCPVVSTDCRSGPAEVLEGGRYGELVPVGEPDLLAAAMVRALDSPIDEQCLVARSRDFSGQVVVPGYIDYFSRQLAASRRRGQQ
ncbi:MAG TPA: glycosyltransferase [Trueperaceae bacterium]